jgi:hypothetical protein
MAARGVSRLAPSRRFNWRLQAFEGELDIQAL